MFALLYLLNNCTYTPHTQRQSIKLSLILHIGYVECLSRQEFLTSEGSVLATREVLMQFSLKIYRKYVWK